LQNIGENICHDERRWFACGFGLPACFALDHICTANTVLRDLRQRAVELAGQLRDLRDRLQRLEVRHAEAVLKKATDLGLLGVQEADKIRTDLEIAGLNSLLNLQGTALSELDRLIKQALPDIPLPGQWNPETITLIVNGRDLATLSNDRRLKQGDSSRFMAIRPMSKGETFVQGLRVNPFARPDAARASNEDIGCPSGWDGFLTTPLAKMRGLSGWETIDLGNVTVTGILRRPPSPGKDAYVSFDLEATEVQADGRTFILDGTKGIRHARYLRIEYRYGTDRRFDSAHENWKPGDILRVTGPVLRDRDRTTFYEVHPSASRNISRISP
ncbi:MAG TPA: hypothetical protein VGC73_00120, partial [Pyrinomonadaceae bacterium]